MRTDPVVSNAIGILITDLLAKSVDVDKGAFFQCNDISTSHGVQLGDWRIEINRTRKPGEESPAPREHWHTEQVKRIVMAAIVEHATSKGMAVASRRAADKLFALLVPNQPHRPMEEPS